MVRQESVCHGGGGDVLRRKACSCPGGAEDLVHVTGGRVTTPLGNEQGDGGAGAWGTGSAGGGARASERETEGGAKTLGRNITSCRSGGGRGGEARREVMVRVWGDAMPHKF